MPRALSPAVFTFMDELLLTSIESVSQSLRDRRVSPLALTQSCLDRIAQIGSRILAFISVDANGALEQARLAEAEIDAGKWRGPLHGVPIAIKDLVDVAGLKTTAASRVFEDRVASRDADVVRRLKQAGAVVLGKTNLHEFAFGGSGVISAYGPVANPWDTQRTTGGSSSGSAAAVAAGMWISWPEAELGIGERRWSDSTEQIARSRRANHTHGSRRRNHARGDQRLQT